MDEKKASIHRSLPICTLGADGHGKTTVTAAIAKVVARIGSIRTVSDTQFENQIVDHHPICEGVGITYRAIDYETSRKHYTQIDCDTHLDIVKLLVSRTLGVQGAIWVVDVDEGVTQESEDQIRIACRTKIPAVIAFLNIRNTQDDSELIDICQQEMRDLLTSCGWDEMKSPILVGDAHKALAYRGDRLGSDQWKPIVDTISALNRCMPMPINESDLHLVMPIYKIIEEMKETVTIQGEVVQGHLSVGQSVDIVGKGDRIKTRCLSIKENEIIVESEPDWLSVGQVVCTPKTIKAHSEFSAVIYTLTHEESGTHIPIVENDKAEIHLWGIDIPARVQLPQGESIIIPGSNAEVSFSLELPLAMEVGTRFEVKKMDSRLGIGVVTGL